MSILKVSYRKLSAFHVDSVLHGKNIALYIPNFYNLKQIENYRNYFRSLKWIPYTHERYVNNGRDVIQVPYGVSRPIEAGLPFNTTYGKGEAAIEQYRSASIKHGRLMANVPGGNPIAHVMAKLSTLGFNTGVATLKDGSPMIIGMPRLSVPSMQGAEDLENKPHVDKNHSLALDTRSKGQFSVNIYLDMPSDGSGAVLLSNSEGKMIRLLPKAGSLCFFSTERPHAVQKTTAGRRLTVQSFVSWSGDKTLKFFN